MVNAGPESFPASQIIHNSVHKKIAIIHNFFVQDIY